jgi:quercetin dioxygenase-like cupin family protein
MARSRVIQIVSVVVFCCFLMLLCTGAYAQQSKPGAKRTVLEQRDLSVPGYEGVLVRTELVSGAHEPPHTHPGDFFGYVLEGAITLTRQGQETVKLKAGDVFFVPKGTVHEASNEGKTTAKLLATFIVEKGKPLITPVK